MFDSFGSTSLLTTEEGVKVIVVSAVFLEVIISVEFAVLTGFCLGVAVLESLLVKSPEMLVRSSYYNFQGAK